jgi:hypothetical protein
MKMKKTIFRIIALTAFVLALFVNYQMINESKQDVNISLKSIISMTQAQDEWGCPVDDEYGMTDYYCSCGIYIMRCWHCGGGCCVSCQGFCSDFC